MTPRPRLRARPVRLARYAAAALVALLMAFFTVAVAVPVSAPEPGQPVALSGDAARTANAQLLATTLRLVNYYPRDRAWEQQWTRFSAEGTAADFALVRGLGATSVRIVVFPDVLGYPEPDPDEQRKLRTTIALADAAGLRVWLTLYDNFGDYDDLAGSRGWTRALLTPYRDDPRISAVEIRNEIKPTNDAAITWAREQVALVHQLMPPTPVTVSLNGSADPEAYGTLLDALQPEAPDLLSYHYYGDPGLAYDHLRRAMAAVGTTPLVIGEAGLSTATLTGRCADRACREAEQLDWYQIVVAAARQAGLSPPAPWTLLDHTPDATKRTITPAGYGYGLFRTDGSAKPAAAVVADAFADRWTIAPQNTDFRETTMQGTRARAWVPWRTSGSLQVEEGAGVAGAPALAISGTASWAGGTTSWYTRPLEVVRAGQVWRVRVAARGLGATGRTTVGLVWLAGDGTYLRQARSRPLDVEDAGWTELSVAGTPPPGAAAVRIHLSSVGNAGTAYFSGPSWTVGE